MGLCIFNRFLVKHYKYLFEIVFWAKFWHFRGSWDSSGIHSGTTFCGTKMGPKIKGVEGVKAKRTKVIRVSAASRVGAAALQASQHERALERTAALERSAALERRDAFSKKVAMISQKKTMQDETIFTRATERQEFGPLDVMCEVSWYWDMAKLVYNFIRDTVELGLNFPGHMLVFQNVVDAQKELAKVDPGEDKWTLWHVCLALENRNSYGLWERGMREMKKMIWQWEQEYYDVDCSPLFMFLEDACDDDPDEPISMCFDTWKTNDPVQAAIFSRMYVKHESDDKNKQVPRVWELRHDVKKALHALKTIAKL